MPVIVEASDLRKYFPVHAGFPEKFFSREKKFVHAIDGVSFDVREKETLSLAGESGCGKTTCGKLVLGLLKPTSGTVRFMGRDIFELSKREMKETRSKMQVVFQDTTASFNPRKTVLQILSQPYLIHNRCKKDEIEDRVLNLMKQVGLDEPQTLMGRFPHQLSGGQRQRVAIARGIALNPLFLVLDEPTSNLDVSVQAGILNLLKDLQRSSGLSSLLITHNLAMTYAISDRSAVMYLGKIVELGKTREVFNEPLHPYTKALIFATPIPNPERKRERERIILKGHVPSPIDPPSGCYFHTRCPYKRPDCAKIEPELVEYRKNHFVSCQSIRS